MSTSIGWQTRGSYDTLRSTAAHPQTTHRWQTTGHNGGPATGKPIFVQGQNSTASHRRNGGGVRAATNTSSAENTSIFITWRRSHEEEMTRRQTSASFMPPVTAFFMSTATRLVSHEGLSRMMGNCHVRFLGEGARATWTPLPDQDGQGRVYEEQPADPSELHGTWDDCDRCGREMLAGEMLY